jgi:hypothetical protein
MTLPTAPSVQELRPDRLRALIYGSPGAGKTTFAAQWFAKSNLIIDLEGGTRFLGGEHFVTSPQNYGEFSQTVSDLVSGDHGYKTVTIDTGSALMDMADAEAAARHGKISATSVSFGVGVGDRDGAVRKDLTRLLASDLGVLLVCHSMRVADEESGSDLILPALPTGSSGKPGIREFAMGRFDNIWFVRRAGPTRDLVLQPNGKYECKSRVPMPENLPLDARGVYEAVKAGCDSLAPVPA